MKGGSKRQGSFWLLFNPIRRLREFGLGGGGFGANLRGLTEGVTVMNLKKMPRFSAQMCCSLFFICHFVSR